jgi:hypothetical protein
MATQEIYIRNPDETEARGPFNAEQVSSLAEAGQVTGDTLVYDSATEQWVALSASAELMAIVFPEKRKLSLKAKTISTLNKPDENAKAITVNEMLAAAEGRTDDTKGKSDPEIDMMRAARIGMIGAAVALLLAAAGEILPSTAALLSMDPAQLLANPLVVLGAIDVILAVLLGLGMASVYPFVRFRAALGLGLIGFMFYAQGLTLPLLQVVAGSVGLYLCTVLLSVLPVIIAAAAAVAGMGTLAWHFLTH